ncbi:unnamed protein product [Rotaria socialis]|uniref:Uncharacterized protein n=1 Tax=Rotaria socialis TaxID=392032 RepID=A0A821DBE4_9BILA|nr:unnamed protein product [Rotaria socialis]CAF3172692.1 unnamed protein product [Rotaria socialis]CAF3444757.1 unnamed protein product [Rotaria socialis]CAF4363678.1 unnamed protein product [Rotaria socialis]CAF4467510.1 unnamed protein product [Rotaria socialis]
MASIPCSSRHTASYMKDIKDRFESQAQNSLVTFTSQPSTTVLQYFNTRVTQRLHHYRSMKRQWQEVATLVRNNSFVTPTCDSSTSFQDVPATAQDTSKNIPGIAQKLNVEQKSYRINDYIATTTSGKENNEKNSIELDPLHSRIQQDLITLRKLIKTKQRKFIGDNSFKACNSRRSLQESASIGTAIDDQENNNRATIRKLGLRRKQKPLERVKISGSKMHHSTPQKNDSNDSVIISTSNSSSTCSQYSKQQQQKQKTKRKKGNKAFNTLYSRLNPPPPPHPLPSDSLAYRTSHESNRKSRASSRKTQHSVSKQSPTSPLTMSILQIPRLIDDKQSRFVREGTQLPGIIQLTNDEELTTDRYTYASSSSSTTPHSTMLKRNTSLLPILLHSTSSIGTQLRDIRPKMPEYDIEEGKGEKEHEETTTSNNDEDDSYYNLLNYKTLINGLPDPVISIRPRFGQDDYGILFEQLDHIRETMPDSNIYDEYARIV